MRRQQAFKPTSVINQSMNEEQKSQDPAMLLDSLHMHARGQSMFEVQRQNHARRVQEMN